MEMCRPLCYNGLSDIDDLYVSMLLNYIMGLTEPNGRSALNMTEPNRRFIRVDSLPAAAVAHVRLDHPLVHGLLHDNEFEAKHGFECMPQQQGQLLHPPGRGCAAHVRLRRVHQAVLAAFHVLAFVMLKVNRIRYMDLPKAHAAGKRSVDRICIYFLIEPVKLKNIKLKT